MANKNSIELLKLIQESYHYSINEIKSLYDNAIERIFSTLKDNKNDSAFIENEINKDEVVNVEDVDAKKQGESE